MTARERVDATLDAALIGLDAAVPDGLLAVVSAIPRWREDDPLGRIVDELAAAGAEALDEDDVRAILPTLIHQDPEAHDFQFGNGRTLEHFARHMVRRLITSTAQEHLEERLAAFQPAGGERGV